MPIRVAILTTDRRECDKDYANPKPSFMTPVEALLPGVVTLPEMEVHIVSCVQKPLVSSPEKLAENVWYHVAYAPKIGWMRTGYQGCIRAVRKKLRQIQPDIVHGQGTERDCAISAVFSGFPNIITIHGHHAELARRFRARLGSYVWCAARLEEFTLPRTQGIICISDYVKSLVEHYGIPTWVVPNAIQKMFFDFPRTTPAPLEKPLLINVGVISERKRQPQLLTLLESLREEGLQFDSLFVGVSSPKLPYAVEFMPKLEQANRKYGGFEHVTRLDDPDFCRLFDRASAMIHFSAEESFGLTFGEAIARGLYLFASDVGAIQDLARGVNRVQILGVNDWEGLKCAIRQWLASGGDRLPRPAQAPDVFLQHFHPVPVAQRHLEIYRELLKTHRQTS